MKGCSMKRWLAILAVGVIPTALLCARLNSLAIAAEGTAGSPNQLTDDEKKAGWKLLFDGTSFDGWHSFKRDGVRPGWQVKDGALVCVDPNRPGDIVTTDKYDWFELPSITTSRRPATAASCSTSPTTGGAIWATGPEVQLEDNVKAHDPMRCGWLYALYQPPIDPNTDKPLDATKPVGEWNHVRSDCAAAREVARWT